MAAAGACHECGAPAADACEVCRRPTCADSYAERDYFGVCRCCLRSLEADGPPHNWPYSLRKPLPAVASPSPAPRSTDVYDVPSLAFDQYQ